MSRDDADAPSEAHRPAQPDGTGDEADASSDREGDAVSSHAPQVSDDPPGTRAIDVRALRLDAAVGATDRTGTSAGVASASNRRTGWALALAVIALLASLFGAWALPVAAAAVIVAAWAVRRRTHRGAAVWALALAVLAALYSVGWLLWTLGQR